MTNSAAAPNPIERYGLRMKELAEHDPQVGAMLPEPDIRQAALQPGLSYAEIISVILNGYAVRPALAERRYAVERDTANGTCVRRYESAYDAIPYGELNARAEALANAWRHHEQHRVGVDEFVCILGFTGIHFATVEIACAFAQAVSVPLQSALAGTELDRILDDTRPAALVATIDDLELAATLAITHAGIRSVIAIDYDARVDDERRRFAVAQAAIDQAGANVRLIAIGDLIAFGRNSKHSFTSIWTTCAGPDSSRRRGSTLRRDA